MLDYFQRQRVPQDVCPEHQCGVVHNATQGLPCEVIDKWKRTYKYALVRNMEKNGLTFEAIESMPLVAQEVIGQVVSDQGAVKYLSQKNVLRKLGEIGMYAEK